MDWELLKQQLESGLQIPFTIEQLTTEQCLKMTTTMNEKQEMWSTEDHKYLYFILEQGEQGCTALKAENAHLTARERTLTEMLVEAYKIGASIERGPSPKKGREKPFEPFRNWLLEHYNNHSLQETPETFISQFSLQETKIPMLLQLESSYDEAVYSEMKKLLQSFFADDIFLIPLYDKEWLLLASEKVLNASEDELPDEKESLEEQLASLCQGLHEMLVTEWMGECLLSVYYPINPSKSLLQAVTQLKESLSLGRLFQYENKIYFPWDLHLERLLYQISEQQKLDFVEHIFNKQNYKMDAETELTLEHFFEMDCNVSETAKKLYIHRNTLIYRLDKFKQETGYDIRSFKDAVLVKVAMLLYKVTKRQ
ncbi:PucR family transcriptional regulator [Marinicrinis lubricantis]|uniref:PucR family transcriptional regulator n=1 Tax=Marinicrinis lubricantis TaxID=2086470 RepID=A0ABW1IPR1_9BACL